MLLELRDVSVYYHKVAALKGITIEVEEGSVTTLIGANGAGKTTTLRAISGLNHPTTGEIYFEGQRIDGLPPEKINKLGIAQVPEGRRIFPMMTVLENLYTGAFLRQDKVEIKKDLENVFMHFPVLKERTKQAGGTLSGGEQQMLAVGRALMSNPKLLLLDEPSLGMSPILVQEVARIIKNLNQEGRTILLVEQNARLALALAQKAYVLETGKITIEGASKELLENEQVKVAYLGG